MPPIRFDLLEGRTEVACGIAQMDVMVSCLVDSDAAWPSGHDRAQSLAGGL